MKSGDIKANPYDANNCMYCEFRNICRKEMLADEEDESDMAEN